MEEIRTGTMVNASEAIAGHPWLAVAIIHDILSDLPREEILATLCTVIDTFFGEWEMPEEECVETWKFLAATAEEGYKLMGVMPNPREAGDE